MRHTRPAADPLFMSAAEAYRTDVIGIVLSGGDSDGAAGVTAIKQHGGIALVQDPREAATPSMPQSAIALDHPDLCLPVEEIARQVAGFCREGAEPEHSNPSRRALPDHSRGGGRMGAAETGGRPG